MRDHLGRDLVGAGENLVGRHQLADQAAGQRLSGGEDTAGDRPVDGRGDADDTRQEPAGAGLGDDAPPGERQPEAGRVGRDANVHRQYHGHTDAHRSPVDSGDDRLGRSEDPQRQFATHVPTTAPERLEPGCVGVIAAGARRQVGAVGEAVACTSHHDGPHLRVRVGPFEDSEQFVQHRIADGVVGCRPVDRHGQHPFVEVALQFAHPVIPSRRRGGGAGRCRRIHQSEQPCRRARG